MLSLSSTAWQILCMTFDLQESDHVLDAHPLDVSGLTASNFGVLESLGFKNSVNDSQKVTYFAISMENFCEPPEGDETSAGKE